jgi:hypothetical protein
VADNEEVIMSMYDVDPAVLEQPFQQVHCDIFHSVGKEARRIGEPPLDVEATTKRLVDGMKAAGHNPNAETIRRYLECAQAGYNSTEPAPPPVEKKSDGSVWPMVAVAALGVGALALILKGR